MSARTIMILPVILQVSARPIPCSMTVEIGINTTVSHPVLELTISIILSYRQSRSMSIRIVSRTDFHILFHERRRHRRRPSFILSRPRYHRSPLLSFVSPSYSIATSHSIQHTTYQRVLLFWKCRPSMRHQYPIINGASLRLPNPIERRSRSGACSHDDNHRFRVHVLG